MAKREQSFAGDAEVFGPYLVYERIGVGGMATVHRAKERGIAGFERFVALKRLLPHLAEDEKFVRAFVREAKLASLLQHPNIIQLYELGRVGHVYFISMELIEGHDVRQILRHARRVTGPPPIQVVLSILCQVCEALEYAHTRVDENDEPLGLVHRDVSPSNVIVSQSGYVKLVDFGIAKANAVHLRTQSGRVKGKMAYMSPEAVKGVELDARSDMFSTGVLAHELLTARPLFATKNDYQTLMRVQKATVAPPSTYNQACPPELDAIVLKALERDRSKRWQSAEAMREALDELRTDYQLTANPVSLAEWVRLAFAQEAPPRRKSHPALRHPGTSTPVRVPSTPPNPPAQWSDHPSSTHTPTTGPLQIPIGGVALPVAEEDDEIIEIAWGGRSSDGVPVVLDEVPDVSEKVAAPALASESPPAERSGSTLVTHVPPPPVARPPTSPQAWARGTVPRKLFEDEDEDTDEDLLFDPPASERQRPNTRPRPRVARNDPDSKVPVVIFRKPAPLPRPIVDTEIGSSIVARERGRHAPLNVAPQTVAILATMAVAGAALVWFLLARADRTTTTAGASTATSLTFALEPRDATVVIDGQGSHTGSPVEIDLEPGDYRVQVEREGYRSWVSAIHVNEGENQTVRVALDRGATGAASVVVRTERPGLTVLVDGSALSGGTPATFELSAGKHEIQIAEDDVTIWRHEFTAAADTHYEFHPVLLDARDSGSRSHRSHSSRHHRVRAPTIETPEVVQASLPPSADAGAVPPLGLVEVGGEPPPAPPPRPAVNRPATAPIVVPPGAVRRVSGRPPSIPRQYRASVPPHVSAKLCIDRRGHVTSATVLTEVGADLTRIVEKALKRWRYRPYRAKGTRVPACFAISFATR